MGRLFAESDANNLSKASAHRTSSCITYHFECPVSTFIRTVLSLSRIRSSWGVLGIGPEAGITSCIKATKSHFTAHVYGHIKYWSSSNTLGLLIGGFPFASRPQHSLIRCSVVFSLSASRQVTPRYLEYADVAFCPLPSPLIHAQCPDSVSSKLLAPQGYTSLLHATDCRSHHKVGVMSLIRHRTSICCHCSAKLFALGYPAHFF